MGLETVTYISDLVATNPTSADPKSEGDNHVRNVKTGLLNSFPNIKGVMPVAHDQVASKSDIAAAQFTTALPSQPGGPVTYKLNSTNSAAAWNVDTPPTGSLLFLNANYGGF